MSVKQKSLLPLLLFVISISYSFGQTKQGYLFDEFQKGRTVFRNGSAAETFFNYNTLKEKLFFVSQDSVTMEVANPENIVIAKIGDKSFEHVKNGVFYERVNAGNNSVFYIQWRSTLQSKGKNTGYGTKSTVSSIDNVSRITDEYGDTYMLRVDKEFDTLPNNSYYLKIKNRFKRFTSANDLAKLYKGHGESIKKYAKDEDIKFDNIEDIKKIIAYCELLN
ncbi:hypothetical protein [Prevotella sp. 10(H)]|uniref:hypothetical protein n=1 Tax=Prevotella sp. 10(H) TaxID=1158294 RepID=UPI0004A6E6CD|nr:hypothetical protein [Prevotella sp. 10(H)]